MHLILHCFSWLISAVAARTTERSIFDKFQQSDFKLKFERIDVVSYDKRFFKHLEIHTFKYNRTTAVINGSVEFNFNMGSNMEVISQAYKFLSNEYRHFPLRVQVNACLAVNKNLLGVGQLFNCQDTPLCPIQKNKTLRICKWKVDESKYPPFIPDGRFMLEHQFIYGSTEIAVVRGYAEISRPIPIPD